MASKLEMSKLLVIGLLLVSSYSLRVSCDVVGTQIDLQQQQQQQQQEEQQLIKPQQQDQQQPISPTGQQLDDSAGAVAAVQVNNVEPAGIGANAGIANDNSVKWEQSPFYLAPFDPSIASIPPMQREFVTKMVQNDLELFREILREAIERRNKLAPSVGLIWKYAAKLIGRLISNRREEMQLPERMEPKPEFFKMLADIADAVIQRSGDLKREKGYSKSNIDTDELYRRTDGVFNYVQSTIEAAPVAAYLKWNELILFRNDLTNPNHDRPLIDEAADLTAVSRSVVAGRGQLKQWMSV